MKKIYGVSILVFLLFSCVCSLQAEHFPEMIGEKGPGVLSVHQITLKADANEKEFEAFIIKELLPFYNKVEGQTGLLTKGDRGIRTGQYAIVLIFDSLADRDRIYPPEGGISEDFEKILEGQDKLWDKLGSFVEGNAFGNHTDYVKILH